MAQHAVGMELEHAIGLAGFVPGAVQVLPAGAPLPAGAGGSSSSDVRFVSAAGALAVVNSMTDPHAQTTLRGHRANVSAMAASASGRLLATGERAHDCDVCVWDMASGSVLHRLQELDHGARALAFSPDERLLLAVGDEADGFFVVLDLATGAVVTRQRQDPLPAVCCAWGGFARDVKGRETGLYLMALGGSKTMTLWTLDATRGEVARERVALPIATQRDVARDYSALCFSPAPERAWLYAGTASGEIVLVHVRSLAVSHSAFAVGGGVCAIAAVPAQTLVEDSMRHGLGTHGGRLGALNGGLGYGAATFAEPTAPSGVDVVVGGGDGTIQVWHHATGHIEQDLVLTAPTSAAQGVGASRPSAAARSFFCTRSVRLLEGAVWSISMIGESRPAPAPAPMQQQCRGSVVGGGVAGAAASAPLGLPLGFGATRAGGGGGGGGGGGASYGFLAGTSAGGLWRVYTTDGPSLISGLGPSSASAAHLGATATGLVLGSGGAGGAGGGRSGAGAASGIAFHGRTLLAQGASGPGAGFAGGSAPSSSAFSASMAPSTGAGGGVPGAQGAHRGLSASLVRQSHACASDALDPSQAPALAMAANPGVPQLPAPLHVGHVGVGGVLDVCFSANASDRFATCGTDNTVRVWDLADYECVSAARVRSVGHPLCVSYANEFHLSGWQDGTLRTYFSDPAATAAVAAGEGAALQQRLTGGTAALVARTSSDFVGASTTAAGGPPQYGRRAGAGGTTGGGQPLTASLSALTRATAVLSGGSGSGVGTGHEDAGFLWAVPEAHSAKAGGVTALALAHNQRFCVTGGGDAKVRVWDLRSREMVAGFAEHGAAVTGLAIYRDDAHVLSCSRDKSFICWDLRKECRVSQHVQRMGALHAIAVTRDQSLVVTCGMEKKLNLWDLREAAPVLSISPVHGVDHEALTVGVSHGSDLVATGGSDGAVKVWDLRHTAKAMAECTNGHSGAVRKVRWAPDDKQLVSVGLDGVIAIWNCYL